MSRSVSSAHATNVVSSPDRFDEALADHRAQTERLRVVAASMREGSVTPVEIPSLMIMARVRHALEQHPGCEECESVVKMLGSWV